MEDKKQTITIETNTCGHCHNDFFTRDSSHEFRPRFCCYCGTQFAYFTQDDDPLKLPRDFKGNVIG